METQILEKIEELKKVVYSLREEVVKMKNELNLLKLKDVVERTIPGKAQD